MSTISVLAAFLRRDWETDISYRTAFALQVVAVFLSLAVFFYLSKVVDPAKLGAQQSLEGGYFAFVTVGLAVLEIAQTSLSSFSRKVREEQTTGTLEALIATPTSPSLIILSSATYELLRAMLDGLLVIAAAVLIFGLRLDISPPSLLAAITALGGCVGLFASLGVAVAAFTVVFKRSAGLLGLLVAGLALLGGVYFPIEVLPAPIEAIGSALPFTWGLDAARAALLGGDVDGLELAGLVGSVAILLPLALLAFSFSVSWARQAGSLGQY